MFSKRFPIEFYYFNVKERDEGRSEMSIQVACKISSAILANHLDVHHYVYSSPVTNKWTQLSTHLKKYCP
jgi:hypothetical protein